MALIWAKVTEADIPPGSVLESVDPVQAALQLGPSLFLEGASERHFPGSSLKADWKSPDERWGQSCIGRFPAMWLQTHVCDFRHFPSQSSSSYQVSGAKMMAPTDQCTVPTVHQGFCGLHLTTPFTGQQPGSTILPGAVRLLCGLWTCLAHKLPVTGSWQGKYRDEE